MFESYDIMEIEQEELDMEWEEELKKDRSRGDKNKQDWHKAIRKMKLAKKLYGEYGFYGDCLNKYKKRKIHCSCNRCSDKTNTKTNKSQGRVDTREYEYKGEKHVYVRGSRIPTTNHRLGKKNYKHSEQLIVEMMNDKEHEFWTDTESEVS